MNQLIGVDLGGSAIKLGRFSEAGDLLAELQVPTPQPAVPGAVTTAIVAAVQQLDPQRLADRVGVGHPGPSDQTGRVARIAINLPGWLDVPLANWLEPLLERPVTLANDGNCALLGEHWLGAARGVGDVLLLTLGTGVGGAVLLDGQLFTGHRGAAAEPGLIGLDPAGPFFESYDTRVRIDRTDAKFVDVIHSNGDDILRYKCCIRNNISIIKKKLCY